MYDPLEGLGISAVLQNGAVKVSVGLSSSIQRGEADAQSTEDQLRGPR